MNFNYPLTDKTKADMNTPIMQAIEDFKSSKATWDGNDIAKVLADYLPAEEAMMKEVWEAARETLDSKNDGSFGSFVGKHLRKYDDFNQFISQYNKK